MRRRDFVVAGALALSGAANAQAGPIRIIWPYAPGSAIEGLIRVLANEIGKEIGDTALVESHVGADGRIGVRDVKLAPPDGRTLLFTPYGAMVMIPLVHADTPYDPFADFEPVSEVAALEFAIASGPMFPGRTLVELATWLKANPDKANFAAPGLGSLPHFLPLRLGALIGVDMRPVPFKGSAPASLEVMAGHIPIVSNPLSELVERHRTGELRILAVANRERSPTAPDLPTFIEQGFDVEGVGWYGIFAPARTPKAVIDRLNSIVVRYMRSEAGLAFAARLGIRSSGTSPAELAAVQRADFDRWAPVIKASGFKGE